MAEHDKEGPAKGQDKRNEDTSNPPKGSVPKPKKPGANNPTNVNLALRPYIEAFSNMLAAWAIPLTPATRAYIQKAAQQKWTTTGFLLEFRKTKAYAKYFPGNTRKDGTVRMSESQWLSGYRAAQDYAGSVGRPFSKKMYGTALANNNSPSEIKAKIGAVDRLKTYAPELREYN